MFGFGRHRLVASAALALTGCLTGGLQGARAAAVPAYFNPSDAATFAPLMFMRQAPPPIDNSQDRTTYAYGPITDSSSEIVSAQNNSSWTGGHCWPFVWANRARVAAGHTLDPANPIFPTID